MKKEKLLTELHNISDDLRLGNNEVAYQNVQKIMSELTIAKEGDLISWTFEGKIYKDKVVFVDMCRKLYYVCSSYGPDLIPFSDAELVLS